MAESLDDYPLGTKLLLKTGIVRHAVIERPPCRMTYRFSRSTGRGEKRQFVALPRTIYIPVGSPYPKEYGGGWRTSHYMARYYLREPFVDLDSSVCLITASANDGCLISSLCVERGDLDGTFSELCHNNIAVITERQFQYVLEGPVTDRLETLAKEPDGPERALDLITSRMSHKWYRLRDLLPSGIELV